VKFISSHVIHFFLMGGGIALILGLLTPTTRYVLPRNPVRF
jgi:uncharacterized membrane protein YphA (DoxX/SURF4 family)